MALDAGCQFAFPQICSHSPYPVLSGVWGYMPQYHCGCATGED